MCISSDCCVSTVASKAVPRSECMIIITKKKGLKIKRALLKQRASLSGPIVKIARNSKSIPKDFSRKK